jgi:hypothetical protein
MIKREELVNKICKALNVRRRNNPKDPGHFSKRELQQVLSNITVLLERGKREET